MKKAVPFAASMRLTGLSALLLASIGLGACSVVNSMSEKAKIDYKSAQPRGTLDVPPDLVSPRTDERVTRSGTTTASEFQQGRQSAGTTGGATASNAVLPGVPGVKLERAEGQRWLVVDMPPARLYPVIRDFWSENGFVVAVDSPQTGIVETDWAENRAKLPQDFIRNAIGKVFDGLYSTGERDKFRVRVEAAGAGSEVFLTHRGLIEKLQGGSGPNQVASTVWTQRPNDPELEAEFLRRLMLRIGVPEARAKQVAAQAAVPSVAGTAAPAAAANTPRARLNGTGANAQLQVDEGFDRAWRRVGVALDRGSFTVEDRDRAKGIYFVRYVDPKLEAEVGGDGPGLLGRIMGKETEFKARQYRIVVKGAEAERSLVTVQDGKGAGLSDALDLKVGDRMLSLLQEQLR